MPERRTFFPLPNKPDLQQQAFAIARNHFFDLLPYDSPQLLAKIVDFEDSRIASYLAEGTLGHADNTTLGRLITTVRNEILKIMTENKITFEQLDSGQYVLSQAAQRRFDCLYQLLTFISKSLAFGNRNLVHGVLNRFGFKKLTPDFYYDDLFQEGFLSLWQAAMNFNPWLNAKPADFGKLEKALTFSNYAFDCIRGGVLSYLGQTEDLDYNRATYGKIKLLRKIAAWLLKFGYDEYYGTDKMYQLIAYLQENKLKLEGLDPAIFQEILANRTTIDQELTKRAKRGFWYLVELHRSVSLDETQTVETRDVFGELSQSKIPREETLLDTQLGPEALAERNDLAQRLHALIEQQIEQSTDRSVLELLYGLDLGSEPIVSSNEFLRVRSYTEVARTLGIGTRRTGKQLVKQREQKNLAILRHPGNKRGLR